VRRSLVVPLVVIVVVAVAATVATVTAGWSPQLGLDLQGGASVVLEPKKRVDGGVLRQSIAIIRNRVDALGVAEPDISRQGSSIVVQLPGVKDQKRALDIVGQTAELRFRPVLEELPASESAPAPAPAGTAPGTPPPAPVKTTPPADDLPDREVVLPEKNGDEVVGRYRLGPAELTGRVLKTARAAVEPASGKWRVDFETTGVGAKQLGDVTQKYLQRPLAIVLDGVVKSAPVIQQQITKEGQITGEFTEREARDLALVLRFGALPVELEPQTVQTVSPTLGRDSLRAGIVAGIGGLALVLLYMILYYRALGIVVVLGLTLTGALLWSIMAVLGEKQGLALTLAGATGIIISVGVTVDSYVVYFERLKDEVRSGKTIRSSVERSFSRAFRTIIAGNTASFIGAALLYWLTVGPVRGFAFFLGLTTLLDVVVAWSFTRPLVTLLARNRLFTEAPRLGVARGLAARPAGGAA
jgi:preprotein translocase subunit SecD